jgi:Asp-tRNA(Asn)/Glu-tRNA(Gln) amidotransferase A subunit family amidase
MPVGIQLVGRPRGEEAVLALAGAVERMQATGIS